MTKKKKADKNEKKKRSNDTAHNRAMTNRQVQDALNGLHSEWEELSPLQRCERLKKLIDFGCSIRGIAKETGIRESTLRRYKPKSKSKADIKHTLAKAPKERSITRSLESALESKSTFQRNRAIGSETKATGLTKGSHNPSRAKSTKGIASPVLIAAKESPIVDDGLGGKESRTEEAGPKLSPLELYKLSHPSNSERKRLVAEMSKSMERRQRGSSPGARSMPRQGRPLSPED